MIKTSPPIDPTPTDPTRRTILRTLLGGATLCALPVPAFSATRDAREFTLRAQTAQVDILGGDWGKTPVWCYSGQAPGPVLRAKQGERLRITVENALSQATTVHWHGLRVPIIMDGVPGISQDPIEAGQSFTYDFEVPDAGTYWYHPHVNTPEQVGRGLHGVLIVEENKPPAVDRDEVWVLDDWRLNRDATIRDDFMRGMDISHGGRFGNLVTINGKVPDPFTVHTGERIRLRLVNVANARIFGLRFQGHNPQIIALDGHPVEPHTPANDQLMLAPGQRADVILDCAGQPGERFSVIDDIYQDDSYPLTDIIYSADTPLRDAPLGPIEALPANPLSEPNLSAAARHDVVIEGGAMGGMAGATLEGRHMAIEELAQNGRIWALNGVAAHTLAMPPAFTMERGSSHIITVRNDTVFPHPMHLHGHAFRILSRNEQPQRHTPWADTVLLSPQGGSAEIAFVADNPGDWLFHCHVLEHVAGGMTSVFRVV